MIRNSNVQSMAILGFAILLMCISIAAPLRAQEPRTNSDYAPGFEVKKNLCENIEVMSVSEDLDSKQVLAMFDGSSETGAEIKSSGWNRVSWRFVGRPPWLNTVDVFHDGSIDVSLIAYDLLREPVELDYELSVSHANGRALTTIHIDDMRATALELKFKGTGDERDEAPGAAVYEIESYFISVDPDEEDQLPAGEVGVEYVNNYPGSGTCNNPDLSKTDDDAKDFAARLHDHEGWERTYTYGNSQAWEYDFNVANQFYVDNVDFAYFSGHGSNGAIWFASPVLDCAHVNVECQGRYGNKDMEWIAFSSCKTLREPSIFGSGWNDWYRCFDGLHQILGWSTNMYDVNFGNKFGKYAAYKDWRIWTAFKEAARKTHGAGWGFKSRKVVLITETKDNAQDHVHGAGYVSSDAPFNDYGWAFTHYFKGVKANLEPSFIGDPGDLVDVDVPDRQAPLIRVTQADLDAKQIDSMPRLVVSPRTVDVSYVNDIAVDFCINYGFFCAYDLEYDSVEAEYNLYDGPHELTVGANSGGWTYMNSATYDAETTSPPVLPSETVAPALASAFWNNIGGLPSDAVDLTPAFERQIAFVPSTGVEDPDSSWDLNVATAHERVRSDGHPIFGPGASLEVAFGDNSEIQYAYFGGWRDYTEGTQFEPITLSDALTAVSASGPDIAIGGMPACDEFLVTGSELGYFEESYDDDVTELTPVWLIEGLCIFDDDSSYYRLLVPSDSPIPIGSILSPSDGLVIAEGQSVMFSGDATSGTPPYQFNWYSDIDDFLGSGQNLTVDSLNTMLKEDDSTHHTITLEVIDDAGKADYENIRVTVIADIICGDADASGGVDIDDVVHLISYIFSGGPAPIPVYAGDADCSGAVDIDDVVYLINFIFSGGNPPCDVDGNGTPDC